MMNDQINYRDILKVEFESRKARNKYYSLRAFAQSLDISSGALSEILNGKRNLGASKAKQIMDKLKFAPKEKEIFLSSVMSKSDSLPDKDLKEHKLNLETFEVISSIECMSILALSDIKGFRLDVEWIAQRLDLDVASIDTALRLMRKVGLLICENGVEKICHDFLIGPDQISSRAVKNYHHQILNKASAALEEQSVEMRDISGISFAIDTKDIKNIKKDILNFQKRMIKKYSTSTKKSELYHLEMALFSLTKRSL